MLPSDVSVSLPPIVTPHRPRLIEYAVGNREEILVVSIEKDLTLPEMIRRELEDFGNLAFDEVEGVDHLVIFHGMKVMEYMCFDLFDMFSNENKQSFDSNAVFKRGDTHQ